MSYYMLRGTRMEPHCPIHYYPSLWSYRRNWSLTKTNWRTDCMTSSCLLGQTPLPLQMLASGQSLSSTSGPGHRLSSSPETGRPESRSKQARKRLWIETSLVPKITPAWGVLCCREEEGTQGEQGVHSDHSLRMTERSKGRSRVTGRRSYLRGSSFIHSSLLHIFCFLTFTLSCVTLQSPIMAKAGGQNSQETHTLSLS